MQTHETRASRSGRQYFKTQVILEFCLWESFQGEMLLPERRTGTERVRLCGSQWQWTLFPVLWHMDHSFPYWILWILTVLKPTGPSSIRGKKVPSAGQLEGYSCLGKHQGPQCIFSLGASVPCHQQLWEGPGSGENSHFQLATLALKWWDGMVPTGSQALFRALKEKRKDWGKEVTR
jgi:hypothetical protein